jgi:hypothetical protein
MVPATATADVSCENAVRIFRSELHGGGHAAANCLISEAISPPIASAMRAAITDILAKGIGTSIHSILIMAGPRLRTGGLVDVGSPPPRCRASEYPELARGALRNSWAATLGAHNDPRASAYLAVRPGLGQARSTLPDLHELMSGSDTERIEERWLCWRLEMPPSRDR